MDKHRPSRSQPPGPRPHRESGAAGRSAPRPATPTRWQNEAEWYDQLVGDAGSEYHREVIFPGVLRLLRPADGQRWLDVGCGQGALCRLVHGLGVQVVGVDAADAMIEAARTRSDAAIDYRVGDAQDLARMALGQFDTVTCILAIANMNPLKSVVAPMGQVLRPGGRLLLVMAHPCFRQAGHSHWGWDETRKVQYRRVDRYLLPRKQPIVTHPGKDPGRYTWTFHRPLESYVSALAAAGLLVDALQEWAGHKQSTSGPRAAAENTARAEIPMFLAIRALRAGGVAPEPRAPSAAD